MNLPVIILKGLVLLPNNEIRLEFGDDTSKSLIELSTIFHDNNILVCNCFNSNNTDITNLKKIGVLGIIKNKIVLPSGNTRVTIEGIRRVSVLDFIKVDELIEASITEINDNIDDDYITAITRKIKYELKKCIDSVATISNGVLSRIDNINSLSNMIDIIVNYMPLKKERICEYANELGLIKRSEMIIYDIYKEKELYEIEKSLDIKVKGILDNNQKEYILKEKLKVIKEEIGDYSYKIEEINKLRKKLSSINAPNNIKDKINKQINRLESIPDISPDISSIRSYIDALINIPWGIITEDIADLNLISDKLNSTHFGLDEVKERIIEYLAVKKNNQNISSPIICLVGPPGVGKTSLSKTIARSINRKFIKISVAGITDEAEILGHMRSYVNATYGKIISSLIKTKVMNPVILIDEVDKMPKTYKGDPISVLLSILDSNQNSSFVDNYIDEEVDLSKVLFILTANSIDEIPTPLLDRLEIIKINGYSEYEKLDIARNYLVPNILKEHNIDININDDIILNIIRNYTMESGVRSLERNISKICRKVVTSVLKDNININNIEISNDNLSDYLGKARNIKSNRLVSQIGVVNGLSCTSYGGDILPIEVNYYKGKGKLILTGLLGNVIKESASIALSYIKANYKKFNIRYEDLMNNDIHIHIPSGSVSKEGPSAGVALTSSIISAFSHMKIDSHIAMTGEITLRGNILPVGGIKEKCVGALINNITTMFIPYDNMDSLDEVPSDVKDKIKFIPVKNYMDIHKELGK